MTKTIELDPSGFSHQSLIGPAFIVSAFDSGTKWVVRPARFTTSTLSIVRSDQLRGDNSGSSRLETKLENRHRNSSEQEITAVRLGHGTRSLRLNGEEHARVRVRDGKIRVTLDGELTEDIAAASFACWVVDNPRNPSRIRY